MLQKNRSLKDFMIPIKFLYNSNEKLIFYAFVMNSENEECVTEHDLSYLESKFCRKMQWILGWGGPTDGKGWSFTHGNLISSYVRGSFQISILSFSLYFLLTTPLFRPADVQAAGK